MQDLTRPTIAYRDAIDADLDWLVALRIETMGPHFAAAGRTLSEEEHGARVTQDFDSVRIILVDGEAAGMVKVVRGSESWRLVQVQLWPRYQNGGIGTSVVRQVIEEARSEAARLELNVLKVNPAKRLYERLGFRVSEDRDAAWEMSIDPATRDGAGT